MDKEFIKILQGYQQFREKYAMSDHSVMEVLSHYGQQPQAMVVACCDSRVDPALILQCDPGDLFVVRNVANIIPPYEKDSGHHGTSAALEFGISTLNVGHLVLLGHSQCGGIQALLNPLSPESNDFISSWVSLVKIEDSSIRDADEYAKLALNKSFQNCLTFPWIKERVMQNKLIIHLWFFDIKMGQIFTYSQPQNKYVELDTAEFTQISL